MKHVVIIGANRGIGLELVRVYEKNGFQVTAVCRTASNDLKETGADIIEHIDVTDETALLTLASKIAPIDILIHNAGILRGDRFPEIDFESMREQFEVNAIGPLKTVLALRGKLAEGAKVGLVTSRVGSIADNSSSNNYGYRTSKTALNMIGMCLSLDLKDQGIAIALLHPGYVRTDMTSQGGLIDADESAAGLFDRMNELTLENTGIFVHTSGEHLVW
jgi:NAD(P)-dependent dehydrogenase (short-subunit alcohol dehydrogenase family)